MTARPTSASARAPGKVILFGEHAINRGQPALAAAVGLYAHCSATLSPPESGIRFRSREREATATREEIITLGVQVDGWREREDYEAIRALKARDFFAPQKYVLASAFGPRLPAGLTLEWNSEVPAASGLGSGGSAFTAMVATLTALLHHSGSGATAAPRHEPGTTNHDLARRADWAHRGDIVAHGGIASALDTQTCLLGGVICYTGTGLARRVPCAPGLNLVIAHSGVNAPTSEVNARVRLWLAGQPAARLRYFQAIGALTRAAEPALARGDWEELGRLMTLNQLVLERIGVDCPETHRLVEAALEAGAYGAKISGSGGGGIVIALVGSDTRQAVATALARAGGKVFTPEVAVPGVTLTPDPRPPTTAS